MTSTSKKLGLIYVAILMVMLPALSYAQTVVVGVEPSYAPWAYVEEGQVKGIAPDALRAMAKQQGFDVQFETLPFSSLIPALRADKIDVVATALTVSEKRAKKIAFTIPWWQVNMSLLVTKNSDKNLVTGLCCGATVGTMTGTTEVHWLKNQLQAKGVDVQIHTYSKATTGVRDLMIGRIDSFLADASPAKNFQQHYADKIRIAGTVKTAPPQVYALGVKKGNKDLLAMLNNAILQLYKSGKWAEVIHKYQPNAAVAEVPVAMNPAISSYKKPIPGLSGNE